MRQVKPPDSWNKPISIGRPILWVAVKTTYWFVLVRMYFQDRRCLAEHKKMLNAELEEVRREYANTSEGGK